MPHFTLAEGEAQTIQGSDLHSCLLVHSPIACGIINSCFPPHYMVKDHLHRRNWLRKCCSCRVNTWSLKIVMQIRQFPDFRNVPCCCTVITCHLTDLSLTEIRTMKEEPRKGPVPGSGMLISGAPACKSKLPFLKWEFPLLLWAFECPGNLL